MDALPEKGQEVVLVKVHHAMNQHLKKKVGEKATVIDVIDADWKQEVRLRFNDSYKSTFWVKICYIEPAE